VRSQSRFLQNHKSKAAEYGKVTGIVLLMKEGIIPKGSWLTKLIWHGTLSCLFRSRTIWIDLVEDEVKTPTLPNFYTLWRFVVILTLWPHFFWEKSHHYALERRKGVDKVAIYREENIPAPTGKRNRLFSRVQSLCRLDYLSCAKTYLTAL
jgi:hypothetical protein